MPDQRFSKEMRVRLRGDFRRVYERGCWIGDERLRMAGELSELDGPRMGVVVSRQVGNAVLRNRWKRLLREAFRLSRGELPPGLDFIVVPKQTEKPELKPLAASLISLTWRLVKRLKREQAQGRRNATAERRSREKLDD
jgi:ribonuclease P protein component